MLAREFGSGNLISVTTSVHILRHPKERRSKCTLSPLEGREGFHFYRAREGFCLPVAGYTLLAVDAPPLTPEDAGADLLLLDSTWKLLPRLQACLEGEARPRSLPAVQTAYPRVSKLAPELDPPRGLASIEALYLALRILGEEDASLLDAYHWREAFLANVEAAGVSF